MRNTRGFTLAETIVYAALASLLIIVIVQAAISISSNAKRSRAFLDINSAAVSGFSRFSRDIRRATTVDVVNSTLGASSGRLALIMEDADGTTDTTTFYLSEAKVKVDENGTYIGDITPGSMAVSNLTFRRFAMGTSTAVRVEMTIAPDASSTVPALNFYGTYVLRGSYTE